MIGIIYINFRVRNYIVFWGSFLVSKKEEEVNR